MTPIARRLSTPELTQRVLEMAKTGVYRESVFEALAPVATKKRIRVAIAHAKQFGLHSVASLRDQELGTYYQLDLVKYQSLAHAIAHAVPLDDTENLAERWLASDPAIQKMLRLVAGLAIALGGAGTTCLTMGKPQIGLGLLASAATATTIWVVQKTLVRQIQPH